MKDNNHEAVQKAVSTLENLIEVFEKNNEKTLANEAKKALAVLHDEVNKKSTLSFIDIVQAISTVTSIAELILQLPAFVEAIKTLSLP
ncbi:hypothetical protein I6Y99_000002 [Vibrio parahaemolyticus]|uniref:hypothetical protein n=1 Tax=Vibrio parahaemolyticus TaxID=670 RepID=UPI000403C270|nr:hypothetical protein [Vibrio parahaemolyticus]AKU57554.1 hypothetical protein FORC8_3994 [Vibrio parahaemolyticus]APE86613.1 Hypothetical protein FORC18_4000 [Vibrio parahaemolyticus]EGQ7792780.1 hypothetical protein [Vibrio parahaemolyticus]EGQ7806075.1 hypothetical protein [Vibrio parahaemolyticus]EGQ8533228.1 hypothetical protein [Vibrio parahaemolyticus]